MPTSSGTASTLVRRPAADLTEAVLENMRRNLERLRYSVLAPGRYTVYLHADEIARLEGILPVLCEQTRRALSEELARLNAGSRLRRYVRHLFGRATPPIENVGGEWHVEFLADPDGEVAPGDILVDSELVLPARPELGVGERTRRITTVHNATSGTRPKLSSEDGSRIGQRETTRTAAANSALHPPPRRTADGPPLVEASSRSRLVAVAGAALPISADARAAATSSLPAGAPTIARARLSFEDESGRRVYDVVKDTVTFGRGGTTYPVDVRIVSSPDVSREHARLRRDPQSGRFFLIDLSSLGTSVNGHRMPPGFDEVDGGKRENGIEVPLEDGARIGLADLVFVDFRIVP